MIQRRKFLTGMAHLGATCASLPVGHRLYSLPQIPSSQGSEPENQAKRRLHKSQNFSVDYKDDVFLENADRKILHSLVKKLRRVQSYVGFGHFNLLSFDELLGFVNSVPRLEGFTKAEIALIERLFFENAQIYGFYGEKVNHGLTDKVPHSGVKKIPGSGHYLLKSHSVELFNKISKQVGPNLYLTSGVRSVVKQLALFTYKLAGVNGNLSRASRSLAPPGYSFHGAGDFDVGQRGLGTRNFTDAFAATTEYKKLTELGYIDIRYPKDNPFGVRFEPWHIKVSRS